MTIALELAGVAKSFTMHLQGGVRLSIVADVTLPTTRPDRGVLLRDVTGAGEDERPRQLDGGRGAVAGVDDAYATLGRRRAVDGRVAGPRRGDEAEVRQSLEDGARERCPLAHDAQDVKGLQTLDDRIRIGEMIVKYGDGRPPIERRPVRKRKRDVLVVVQDGDSVAFLL